MLQFQYLLGVLKDEPLNLITHKIVQGWAYNVLVSLSLPIGNNSLFNQKQMIRFFKEHSSDSWFL